MASLAPPKAALPAAVAALKEEANENLATRGHMERTVSQDIREEREDLKRAAEQSVNAIMDLNLDGAIRWISPSWEQLTGVTTHLLVGKKVSDIITSDHKTIFTDAIDAMRTDETKSRIIRFNVGQAKIGTAAHEESSIEGAVDASQGADDEYVEVSLEAQGIMVYDRSTGHESHTMWMIKPAIPREITIDLPEMLVESLGIGAHVLAQYLTQLADTSMTDNSDQPPPLPVLCRICERSITPWWFEKHTELCLQEHRAEMDVQFAHEALSEHRTAIVKVLDALEAQAKKSRLSAPDSGSSSPAVPPEYKGLAIGPTSQPTSASSSALSSGRSSPAIPVPSASAGYSHHRAKSFAVRRPLARIVELVLDLCDTAMEINTPSIRENHINDDGEIRTQSPSSDSRISQVNQWQSPSAGTLESEAGLSLLCDDTQKLCMAKVEAVFRCRRILEYSERIRREFDVLVQECIDEALAKAARIAAGELSDASDNSSTASETNDKASTRSVKDAPTSQPADQPPGKVLRPVNGPGPSSLAMALRNASDGSLGPDSHRRVSNSGVSTRSNSPMGSRTPRSLMGSISSAAYPQHKRNSVVFDQDPGAESDSSYRSSLASASRRAESPSAELSLSRVTSTRGRKRTSLALPSLQGANSRQESPVRAIFPPPLSPLRSFKPRVQSGESSSGSPLTSPLQGSHDFTSPIIRAQTHHHRRQSSVALSESFRTGAPGSPRLSGISNPQPKPVQTSIRDFEIIKPISKGAFGSVYLAKKKNTGDYYAIKVLKKGDMVAKNQVTNVKAERAIMMWQGESDFVAKLYWTFSSKDYLYLVMEYLNGGDCASLIKTLGGLPEDWAKKYLAEVVLGVQHLHSRQIVHRDLKPDNLLIDQQGHLKLTDFGLSRMGLVGRQKRMQANKTDDQPDLSKYNPFRRVPSMTSSRSTSFDFHGNHSPADTPSLTPAMSQDFSQPSYFSLNREPSRDPPRRQSSHRSDSGDSDALQAMFRRFSVNEDVLGTSAPARQLPIEEETGSDDAESPDAFSLATVVGVGQGSSSTNVGTGSGTPPQAMLPPPMALFDPEDNGRRFVGTPDYLAPETINGVGQDEMSDWWSLGCILFECLYGHPPFHAPSPDQVFENILARRILWPDEEEDVASDEAKDLIDKLLTLDPKERLGSNRDDKYANDGDEIRAHPWFSDIDWNTLREDEASFVPQPANAEDTEYFDARGAMNTDFKEEFEDQANSPLGTPGADYPDRPHDALSRVRLKVNSIKRGLMPLHIPPHVRDGRSRRSSEPAVGDDFGNFQFKNLPVLEKANKDVLSKLRAEAMQVQGKSSQAIASSPSTQSATAVAPSLEASPIIAGPVKRTLSISKHIRAASPSLLSQASNSPVRQSQPSSPLLVSFSAANHERRKTSSGSSSLSQQASASLQPGSFFDIAKHAKSHSQSSASSPVKLLPKGNLAPLAAPIEDPASPRMGSPRQRSHTVSSTASTTDSSKRNEPLSQMKRRSQVFDVSPSSSDTEDQRQKALLRVQRRRQSSRRLSQITLAEGPMFRPLDVLICEDHPVSRLVMERLLEKLRCRTISVQNGSEAMRYAMSEVKFDIIMMEFKLPQINGADVARMIRETKNANTHTPIVAVTGYLKELQAPHDFDALIEKPPDTDKLSEVMGRLCMWKIPPPDWTPAQLSVSLPGSNLRKASTFNSELDSPTSTAPSAIFSARGSGNGTQRVSSREDSITSSSVPDVEGPNVLLEKIPPLIIASRQSGDTQDWTDAELEKHFGGLGISGDATSSSDESRYLTPRAPAALVMHKSAPAALDAVEVRPVTAVAPPRRTSPPKVGRRASPPKVLSASPPALVFYNEEAIEEEAALVADSGDDEDDELGNVNVRARSPKKKGKLKREQQQQQQRDAEGRASISKAGKGAQGGSKLATEMLRTNSQGSVVSGDEAAAVAAAAAAHAVGVDAAGPTSAPAQNKGATTPPSRSGDKLAKPMGKLDLDEEEKSGGGGGNDVTPRPLQFFNAGGGDDAADPDPTPRKPASPPKRKKR